MTKQKPDRPIYPPQDWAYLAGMIDGEGTIYLDRKILPKWKGVIRVPQKDRTVLDYFHQHFQVGHVYENKRRTPGKEVVLHGVPYDNFMCVWVIGTATDIKWIASECLPYLKIKHDRAVEMIQAINTGVKRST